MDYPHILGSGMMEACRLWHARKLEAYRHRDSVQELVRRVEELLPKVASRREVRCHL